MTKDEIIRLAREADIETDWSFDFKIRLERFAALVAAHEREACAKVCEDMSNAKANMNKTWRNGCSDAAAAIRVRSNK